MFVFISSFVQVLCQKRVLYDSVVARWETLATVEKVLTLAIGSVPCHTFQDCCDSVIMHTGNQ
jgi:hypothetical protein